MQLSLRFCFYEIQKRCPEASLTEITARELAFSSTGVLVSQDRCIEDTLYFDLLPNDANGFFKNITVICTPSRAIRFAYCTVIVVPEDINLPRLFDDISLVFSKFARWRDEVEREVASRCDLDTVLAITRRMERNPMWIANRDLKMVAGHDAGSFSLTSPEWNFAEQFGYLPYQTIEKLMETGEIDAIRAKSPAFIAHNTECFQNSYATKSIYRHNRHYGNVFIVQYYNALTERDREIAEQLGQILSYSPFTQRDYTKEYPMGLVFIEELLSGAELNPKVVEQQAQLLGWSTNDSALVLVSVPANLGRESDGTNNEKSILSGTCSLLQANGFGQSLVFDGCIVTIIRGDLSELSNMRAKVCRIVSINGFSVGASERFTDFSHLQSNYRQARIAASFGANENIASTSYSDVFVQHISQELQEALPPFDPVETLRRFDDKNRSNLCETLSIWIACNGNMSHTAKELHVHRNTVIARIDKIRSLTSLDLDSFDTRIRLYLALRASSLGDALFQFPH